MVMGRYLSNIQCRIMVLVHCPSPHCHLSINQVSLQSHLYFPRYGLDRHAWWKKWLRGDNSINIQGRIMVLVHCPSPHCHLSINQVSLQSNLYFPRYGLDRHAWWKKWLRGDNSINIQGRIMVLKHYPSPHCHLSINQVSFQWQQ